MNGSHSPDLSSAVAIVGMAGRFPGSRDIRQFWRNLRDGVESIRFFAPAELRANGVPASAVEDPDYVPANGFLDGIELFDADFFGIPPREAGILDPQHRFLLQCAWEALEDSGYVPEAFDGKIGVFAGVGASSYLIRNILPQAELVREAGELNLLMGSSKDFAVTRIAYKLDLRGPAVNVNTACSTGLVAVHLACQNLLDYRCDLAIAGGAGIQVPQDSGYLFHLNGIASPDGSCRAFDAAAAGTVHGNGVGLVALRRLEDAIEARDPIRAVILGSAVNNDGAGKVGYTAPGQNGQAAVIAEALAVANCDPETVSYIEAHGTGTRLGDPVEVAALRQAFGAVTRQQYCAIGSVKSNIGHLDEAAGVAGLIKAALALQHRQIPPSLHYRTPNPEIDFAGGPFFVNAALRDWTTSQDAPRRAGVSSFGIGGTNAHAVLEEAPEPAPAGGSRPWQILTLSARTESALRTASAQLAEALAAEPAIPLADAAFTLHTGRRAFEHRAAVVCRDSDEAARALRAEPPGGIVFGKVRKTPQIAFLFSGQGSQYAGMGQGLYESEPVFRESFDRCAAILRGYIGEDIRGIVFPPGSDSNGGVRLRQTALAQPCLFAFEYALARLWMSFGIAPAYLAGHSVGEYTAAHFAGVMSLEDTLRLLADRGRTIQNLPRGCMLSVALSEAELSPMLNGTVTAAVRNAPGLTVLAGDERAIADFEERLAAEAIPFQRLETSHAFHSPMMEPAVEPFRLRVAAVPLSAPKIPLLSNLTGKWMTPAEAVDPSYWSRHMRHPVEFSSCLDRLAEIPEVVLLEVGPGEALKTIAQRHPRAKQRRALHSVRHPRVADHDSAVLLRALAQLWADGAPVDWPGFHAHEKRRRVSLPTYPFEPKRYWIDPPRPTAEPAKPAPAIEDWFYVPEWRVSTAPPRRNGPSSWLVFGPADERTDSIVNALRESCGRAERAVAAAWLAPFLSANAVAPRILFRAELGVTDLLFLAQALGATRREGIELTILSEDLYSIDGTECLNPDQALVAGAAQTIPLEYAVRSRAIDAGRDCSVEALVRELNSDASDSHVALRGGKRFTRGFAPKDLAASDGKQVLRDRGVYLITGGFGSMGLAFAAYFAQHARARLVLAGRRGLPAREAWERLLREGPPELARIEFAALKDAAASARRAGTDCKENRAFPDRPELREALQKLCAGYVGDYLRTAAPFEPGDSVETAFLRDRLRVKPACRRFFDGLIEILIDDGYLRENTGWLHAVKPIPRAADLLDAVRERYPEMRGAIRLLERCTAHYPRALSGEAPGIEALYPDGTPDFLNACARETLDYSTAPQALKAAAGVVRAFADARGPVSILEAGGGNGDLTKELVQALEGSSVRYRFTDISPAFVANARERARERGFSWMDFGLFDISRDPEEQGLPPHSFDVVAAYNVTHVAPDISGAIANLRKLLKPGGLIVLGETQFLYRWDFMCWGLAEDLWAFRDGDRRGGSPFLSIGKWESVLREAGFELVSGSPDGAEIHSDTGLIFALDSRPEESHSRIRGTIGRIREIERLGAETLLCRGDVSDPSQLREICQKAQTRFGPINGIVHTAGVLGQGMIRTKTPESVNAVLAPKVQPMKAVEEIFGSAGSKALEFLILCSSFAAISPTAGQFDYAAANAWLDAFSHYAARRYGWRVTSIDWNFWQELGMVEQARSSAEEKQAIVQEIQKRGWAEAGVAAFAGILNRFAGPQIVVSPNPPAVLEKRSRLSHSLLQQRIAFAAPAFAYAGKVGPATHWEIGEHRPGGIPVLVGTAYIEMAAAAFEDATGKARADLRNVFLVSPMVFKESETREIRVILKPSDGGHRFFVVSRAEGQGDEWVEHAHGDIAAPAGKPAGARPIATDPIHGEVDFSRNREHPLAVRQRTYSRRWQCLNQLQWNGHALTAHANLPEEFAGEAAAYRIHPALLDAIVGASALRAGFEEGLPFSYGQFRLHSRLPERCVAYCRFGDVAGPETFTIDLSITDPDGNVCLEIENYTMRRIRERPAPVAPPLPADHANNELVQHATGSLASLEFRACGRPAPGDGQVEIEVHAAGLNFIEVLFALGMLPQFEGKAPARFGLECSGLIARVGPGVTGLRAGDEVMVFSESSFSRYTLADARAVRPKPARLSFEAAATVPAAYCTAYYALVMKAGLRAGEKVLIHSAGGGVGLAALQIARWIGAEIFATAGSEEKRQRLLALGARHAMSSRTLDFAAEVSRLTDGRGVDVVLNSLGGEFQSRSLDCLAPYGRFLEVGKRDFAAGRKLDLAPFARKLSFFAIDVGTDLPDFERLWDEVASHVDAGDFGPLPLRTFPIAQVADAFDYMAQARHFGKIVIVVQDRAAAGTAARRRPPRALADIVGLAAEAEDPVATTHSEAPKIAIAPASARHPRPALTAEFRAPAPGPEAAIAAIWEELLGVAPVGGDDNFFELRGDSLLAAQVFSRLYRSLNVKLPLNAVFEAPTPAGLAVLVDRQMTAAMAMTAPRTALGDSEEEGEL